MPNPLSRLVRHFNHSAATPKPTNVARYPVAYTRTPRSNELQGAALQNTRADFDALSEHYRTLTGGKRSTVNFVCNGNNATIHREFGNSLVLRGRVTSQPFDPYAQDDVVRINSAGVSGHNSRTNQPLTAEEKQKIIDAAKFALGHGYVKSTPFAPDVRMTRL